MRKLIPFILLLCAVACNEISYKDTQPKGKSELTKVPKSLQGSYVVSDPKDQSTDTLFIDAKGYYVASDNKEKLLGDSLKVKSYKGYYFINVNENPEWLLRIVKVEKNGDLIFMSMPTAPEKFNALIKRLSHDVHIDSLTLNDEKLYQIDPNPKELMTLVEKGYFSERVVMKKIK